MKETNIEMEKIILHHTASSPYSEKIRLMFGYTNTEWYSLIAPSTTVKRPVQEKFVGGYSRRIPLLQVGSDIYCDSYTITNKIAELTGYSELGTNASSQEIKDFIKDEGTDRYEIILNKLLKSDIMKGYYKNLGFGEFITFVKGRYVATKKANLNTMEQDKAQEELNKYISQLDDRLQKQAFLFSLDKPTLGDFSAYHMIWWLKRIFQDPIQENKLKLTQWYKKMSDYRKEDGTQIAPEAAYKVARNTEPLPIQENMKNSPKIGKEISLLPTDFLNEATLPIKGILVGENEFKYVIKRETPETGVVHVHFPKHAYGACL